MKYIVILMVGFCLYSLFNSAITPPVIVGDCFMFVDPNKEEWDSKLPSSIDKIIQIGKTSYRIVTFKKGVWVEYAFSNINFYQLKFYKKVECPKVSE